MKILKIFLISLFVVSCFWAGTAKAQDNDVNVQVEVLKRKATDTINDFSYGGQDFTQPSYKAVLGIYTDLPSANDQAKKIQKKINWEKFLFLLPVYDIYYVTSRLIN